MDFRRPGLDPDERLLARAPASFRGATAASARSTLALSAARKRMDAYFAWREHAERVGFTTTGPEMVLGVTNARLVVWSTTFWLSRPAAIAGKVPLTDVAEVATSRHGIVTGLAVALKNGAVVEVEAMRGRRLRRLADALQAALEDRDARHPRAETDR
ncbi:MAG: hypothetical protein ACLPVY_11925 [Acidimicrobiia bacterium]